MNRSLAAFGLSFSQFLAIIVGGYQGLALADERVTGNEKAPEIQQLVTDGKAIRQQSLSEDLAELIKHGKEIQQSSTSREIEELVEHGREAVSKGLLSEEIQTLAAEGKKLIHANPLAGENWQQKDIWGNVVAPEAETAKNILIFASYSLGDHGLEELLEGAASYPNATVVFRGIPAGMSLGEGVKKIQELAVKKNPVPNVVINPTLFEKYGVTDVPTIVLLEAGRDASGADEPQPVASVKGLSDPVWLLDKVSHGDRGELGVHGNIVPIKEPDLIKVMQARTMAIDWEEKKRVALERCWKNLPNHNLPPVTKGRTRIIDPTVVVTKDIVSPNGAIIAQAGTKVNPLSLRPFTQLVAVFDPLDKTQLARVQKALVRLRQQKGVDRVTYIATRFCADKGLDGYKEISDAVNAPVYLLTSDIVERFELQSAPSIIYAGGDHFLVEEIAHAK